MSFGQHDDEVSFGHEDEEVDQGKHADDDDGGMKEKLKAAGKNAVGGVDAAWNMAANVPAYIYSGMQGLGTLMTTGSIDRAGNAVRQMQESNFGLGAPKPFTKEGEQVGEMLGHGQELVTNAAGDVGAKIGGELGRTNAQIAAEVGLNFLPIPGGKFVRKLGKGIEKELGTHKIEDIPKAKEASFGHADDVVQDTPSKPMEAAVQQELPFSTSVEDIAAKQHEASPQRDMFVENEQLQQSFDPYQEAAQKQRDLAALDEQKKLPNREAEVDAAYADRQQQLLDEQRQAKQADIDNYYTNVEDQLRAGKKSQRGAVDIEALIDGFRAMRGGKQVGYLKSNLTPEQSKMLGENANIDIVKADVKGEGVGSALYKAWHDAHEGNVAPSGKTTQDAWKVWKRNYPEKVDAFVTQEAGRLRDGAPRDVVLGNITDPSIAQRVMVQAQNTPAMNARMQRGAIDFKGITDSLRDLIPGGGVERPEVLSNIIGKNLIPNDPLPADILSKALSEGKDTDAFNWTKNTASGASLEGMTRKSALVQGVSRIVQNALKRADLYIQKTVFPVEKMFRQMSTAKIDTLHKVFKEELFNEQRLTVEQLHERGLDEKQMQAYTAVRQMFDNTLSIQNTARKNMGLKEISSVEHYMSSRWQGDFRQPVYTADGKLAWYLAADTKYGLNKQIEALKKAKPDLVIDPKKAHQSKAGGKNKNDLQSMYTTMLDILGRDDPAVQKIKDALEDSVAAEAFTDAGQSKHFKHKANIRGFVGDRPGYSSKSEALEMFHQQVQYAKNAYHWSAMQEVGGKLKEVFSNEQLNQQQPKNMEYAKEYYKNALGHSEAKWVQGIENAFRDLGVSPKVLEQAAGGVKSFFILQKLGASVGYTLSNLLQTINTVPHLVDAWSKHGGNPLKAVALGLATGPTMAAGHYVNKLGGNFDKMIDFAPNADFYKSAFKYAEDNGVTSRSIYDESPITSRGMISTGANMLGKTMTIPETFVRSTSYMMLVSMLKDSKKFKSDMEIFQKAEELSNAAMVDYRTTERPMGFAKLGAAGNVLNTLQTYPINFYNQWRYFGKEAVKGNYAPLAALAAIQYAIAGIGGVPGANDADKAFNWIKEKLPTSAWAKVKDFDPKLWALENLGESAVYGALSTGTGVSMTSRVQAPGGLDMIQAPGGPVMDIAKQIGSIADFATEPNATTFAQAARNSAPTGLQGYLETGPFNAQNTATRPDGTEVTLNATKLAERKGNYIRTPEEKKLRSWGLRSQREAVVGEANYRINNMERQTQERLKTIPDKFYDAVRRGDMEKAKELNQLYTQINGAPISDKAIEAQAIEEYTTAIQRKGLSATKKVDAMKGYTRLQQIIENRDKAYER